MSDNEISIQLCTLNEAWKASRSAVGILSKVQSLAISAPVVDSSNLDEGDLFRI